MEISEKIELKIGRLKVIGVFVPTELYLAGDHVLTFYLLKVKLAQDDFSLDECLNISVH